MSKKKSILDVTLFTNGKKVVRTVTDPEKIRLIMAIANGDVKSATIPLPSVLGRILGEALDNAALDTLNKSAEKEAGKERKVLRLPSESEAFNAGAKAWEAISEFKKAYCVENTPLETSAHRAGWMGCYRWLTGLLPHVKVDGPKCQG